MRRVPCLFRRLICAAALLAFAGFPPSAGAQAVSSGTAAIRGVVTTLGETLLPGVTVRLQIAADGPGNGAPAASTISDDRGRFELVGVRPGSYRLIASLTGFRDLAREVVLEAGRASEVALDLQIAGISETINVSPVTVEAGASLGSAGVVDFSQPEAPSDASIESALPLVPGVVRGPAGISIKGGRPTQSSYLLEDVDLADPSTGETDMRIPRDAIGSLEVLPSPYAVEYGRFSSGVSVMQPRRGGDSWRASLGNINPAFRTKRDHPLTVLGVESFIPRVWVRGPLVKDRLTLAQSVQYRFSSRDIRSRPQDERRRAESLGWFTRVDAALVKGHTLTATLGASLERREFETLGTFDPPEATASRRQHAYDLVLSESSSLGRAMSLETTLHAKLHDVEVYGQGLLPMEIRPEGHLGNYFNDHDRRSWGLQWRESLSGIRQRLAGTHFYKLGVDVARGSFDGTSVSRPVEVRRADGTLARQIQFESIGERTASATDVALFVQDRWQPVERVIVEAGLRLDRNGVVRESILSPRLGLRIRLGPADRVTLGAGVGRFAEGIPLAVGSIEWVEPRTVTDYAADGSTAANASRFAPRVGPAGLRTPRALTWHLESDFRVTTTLSLRADVLNRQGRMEHTLVEEVEGDSAWLTLDSRGRSHYRELAVGARYTRGTRLTMDVSYVRSLAEADLNPASAFLGSLREPLIRPNVFARSDSDVPNRLVAQLRGETESWRMAAILECRDGLPYSAVDELQEYVGTPNETGRLPAVVALDVSVERRIRIKKTRWWVGLQLLNALGRFMPVDVQRNIAAADAGAFYNAEPRRLRLTLRL